MAEWVRVEEALPVFSRHDVYDKIESWSYEVTEDILFFCDAGVVLGHLYRDDYKENLIGVDEPGTVYENVTHWLPIPAPPADHIGGAGNGL